MGRIGKSRISFGHVAAPIVLGAVVALMVVVVAGCGNGAAAGVGVEVQEGQGVQVTDTVTVSGWAEVAAAPDEAVISVGVQNDGADAAQALDQNSGPWPRYWHA